MKTIFQYNRPVFEKCKNIVIFGCFKSARNFAMRLLNQNIRFDYFLCPVQGEYVFPRVLNKPVIGFEECRGMDDFIIVSSRLEMERAKEILYKEKLIDYFFEIESLCPAIQNQSALIIWGTGGRAKNFYNDYRELLNVKYFCDSDEKKAGTYFEGKEVIHYSNLESLSEDATVIIASTFYEDIFEKAVEAHIKKNKILILQYSLSDYMKAVSSKLSEFMVLAGSKINDLILYVNPKNYAFYEEQLISELVYNFKKKRIVLYGENSMVEEVEDKFKLLDLFVSQKIGRSNEVEDGSVYNLLYYVNLDEVVLLTDKFSEETEDALAEMEINSIWMEAYNGYQIFQDKRVKQYVDPNLGVCFHKQGEQDIGFIKYEYSTGTGYKPIKIVLLGGSTTAAFRVREKPWGECLSEKLKAQGVAHIIYCGGIQAYTVSQELVKLVRDVLVIEPDMVISYSGANDMGIAQTRKAAKKNPFISLYQTRLFTAISRMKGHGIQGVYWGLENNKDFFDYWYDTERMMHAICKEFHIKFKAFLQPALGTKADCCQEDADIAVLYGYLYDIEKGEYFSADSDPYSSVYLKWAGTDCHTYYCSVLKWAKRFREGGNSIGEKWFCDLSALFDYKGSVYMDDFHVYEKGNQMIADRIMEEIKDEIDIIISQNI